MTDSGLLIDAIERATKEVFETMLAAEVTMEVNPAENDKAAVVSLVGLTGNWSGTGMLSCTPGGAGLVAARMLMMEINGDQEAIDSDVLDAVAELTNMVIGNVKNLLAEHLGEMAISIPTVVYGRNFHFRNFSGMSQASAKFDWEGNAFEVKIALAPTFEQSSPVRQRLSSPAFSTV